MPNSRAIAASAAALRAGVVAGAYAASGGGNFTAGLWLRMCFPPDDGGKPGSVFYIVWIKAFSWCARTAASSRSCIAALLNGRVPRYALGASTAYEISG